MSCPDLTQIYAYLDGELPAEDRLRLEEHLETCCRCRQLVADRRLFLEASSSLSKLDLPPDFSGRVMAGLPPLKSPVRLWLWLAGGAYLLFSLMVAGLALGTRTALFPVCLQIFKNIFNLAADLSNLIIRLIQQAYGFIKALRILAGVMTRLLADVFPSGSLGLVALVLGGVMSLALIWMLLRPTNYPTGEKK
ncbi:MAG: zf-HC2 domain-containing protein [Candidatus Saccharicenans sp.]|jgi:predicted anti-sigma-YlaC factor YlaD|nr:zf-HC2 domain-containing protein [Candidatus Saccharicenans sp.]MDH7574795.1 zf-HC2 domain-containing protein [Candidatus Saccharicenans sp.]